MADTPAHLDAAIRTLASLGFTDLEATVYAALVSGEGDTGYALAKATGKPVANVYKAIESLEAKGAIVVAGVEPRTLRAVDPGELIGALRSRFEGRASEAEQALKALHSADDREGLFRLKTTEQAWERASAMIRGAERTLLIDAFPNTLGPIEADIEDAARRGVKVVALTYSDEHELPGTRRLVHRLGATVLDWRHDEQLILNADAERMMMAQFSIGAKSVLQAIWTDSLFLSMHYYDSFFCQFVVHQIDGHIERHGGPRSISNLMDELMDVRLAKTPGFERYYGEAMAKRIPDLPPRQQRGKGAASEGSP